VLGSNRLLGVRDLPPLDEKIGSAKLGVDLKEKWGYSCKCSMSSTISETYGSSEKPGRYTLVFACARSLGWRYAAVILPRLLLVVFTYAQPFLITEVLTHVERPLSERKWTSTQLVAATGIVYLGIAVSYSILFGNYVICFWLTLSSSHRYMQTITCTDSLLRSALLLCHLSMIGLWCFTWILMITPLR
jgi:hypothetical protein